MPSKGGAHERACDVFLIARSVAEELEKSGGLAFPIPVAKAGVVSVVEKQSLPAGIERIDLLCHDWRSKQFYSALFRYKDRAEIHYSAHENLCWRRFAVVKEAIHLLIDTEARHFTTNATDLIERLIVGGVFEPNTPIDSERMGIFAAMEILLPWKLRPTVEAMRDAGESDFQIALQCRVPEKYVTAMLHGVYGKSSKRLNEKLDGK